jgi:DnaJ-class molecular chaperone
MSDDEVEGLVYEVFRQSGAFIPQSVEEVAKAEEDMVDEEIDLPPSLLNPALILGHTEWRDCQACLGFGTYKEDGMEYDCSRCDGTGEEPR